MDDSWPCSFMADPSRRAARHGCESMNKKAQLIDLPLELLLEC
ncbi:hypothetical protein WKW80_24375 [Variovorax humicola]|uniref:Uncharacterized protein n=1 Tax=Variovorax humicola TaxID=1769758 RepID=A0ABU8W523_9BURK